MEATFRVGVVEKEFIGSEHQDEYWSHDREETEPDPRISQWRWPTLGRPVPGQPVVAETVRRPESVITLVTGAAGQLGRAIVRAAAPEGQVVALPRVDLDVTVQADVQEAVAACRPEVVVNCAGWVDVDGHEVDPDRSRRINVDAPRFLREACETVNAHLVHISTDYVFDGRASDPYPEDHPTAPLSVYGATKLEGEAAAGPAATVVRTTWTQAIDGPNMVKRVLDGLAGPGSVALPSDRRSTPSFCDDVAQVVMMLAIDRHPGVVHAVNEGITTWADFAREVAVAAGYDPDRVVGTVEADYDPPRSAKRPLFSALDNAVLRQAGYPALRHHREFMEEILARVRTRDG